MQKRFESLTGIRAVAAIMVFVYHNKKYWRTFLPEFVIKGLNEFHIGVSIFFVLSGFLIAYTYEDKPLKTGKEYTKYLLIRLARIFPVYILLLTIQFIDFGFPKTNEIFYDYSLLKGFSDVHNLDGIPQSWSLTVELCFYISAPLIYCFTNKSILKTVAILLLQCALVIGVGYLWHYTNGNKDRWLYNWWFVLDGTFFGRWPEFFMGVLLAWLLKKEHSFLLKLPKRHKTLIGFTMMIILVYAISFFEKDIYHHGTEQLPGLLIRNLLLPFFIGLLLYGLMVEENWFKRALSSKLMVLLGNASYIFYLIHIGYINQKIAGKFLLFDRNFMLLWLISIAAYLLVEKPAYSFARKLIKRW